MTIVKSFKCAFCNNDTWHLMKNRHGADAWLQFQCAECGGTANMIQYEQAVSMIEKLIDDDARARISTLQTIRIC